MNRRISTWILTLALAADASAQEARQILEATGVKGGLIVHLGCDDGKLTAALRANHSFIVHGLDTDGKNVEAARQHIQSLGLYGKVSAELWDGKRLPYIENLANLVVAERLGGVSMDEVMRVLAPNGIAYVAGKQTVKPRPKAMDDWTHYLYNAGNNAVSHDTLVGPPRHMQWIAGPRWSRHHDHMSSVSAMVAANGRIFAIVEEGPRAAIWLPPQWSLVARDAFNGTVLWRQAIAEWNTHLWPLKSGPNQLPRRLVAVGDRVYVTLGINAPVTALDAATGKTLRAYDGTAHTDEILFADGTLFLLVGQSPNKWQTYRHTQTYVWDNTQRANKEWAWDQEARHIVAMDAASGRLLWKKKQAVAPLTLGVDRNRVYGYDGGKVVALSRKDGAPAWASEPIVRKQPFPTGYGPTLVVQDNVVMLSVEQKAMTALDAATGKTLWSSPHYAGGHMTPDDVLVINGLAWCGRIAGNKDDGLFTGRDLRSGEIKVEFMPSATNYWFHHRCYRAKATDRFVITSRTGTEFVDLAAKTWDINHWVRGACLYGIMPANGMIYNGPHPCGCYLESKLFGFNALAPARGKGQEASGKGDERLERGSAFTEVQSSKLKTQNAEDWPTYRSDAARSGSSKTKVPTDLKRAWQTDLGAKLSSVVVAEGKLFVASVDTHTVYALDAATGKKQWSFISGGRVDSPPTIWQGRAVFGSADGCVYCLRADDGVLVWKFRAAPADQRMMSFEQLESSWPVSGSVLVLNGIVHCVAGRSAFLDGGMRLLGLDAKTGQKVYETILNDRDPKTGRSLHDFVDKLDMPTALPDIFSSDGRSIYMRAQAFDLKGTRREFAPMDPKEQTGEGVHLFSRSGFLDGDWWHRSFWMYGKGVQSGYGGWFQPANYAPAGRLMVFDDTRVYGFDRKPEAMCNASVYEYFLYGADKQTSAGRIERVQKATGKINAASSKRSAVSSDWATRRKFSISELSAAGYKWAEGDMPLQARGMVLAGGALFVAGPPDLVNEEEAFKKQDDPAIKAKLAEQAAALEGKRGALLWAFSANDGKKFAAWQLDSMPVFDGMAAANGRLFFASVDGKVICLAGEGTALRPAPDAPTTPLDISVKATDLKLPSKDADFAKLNQAHVFSTELGYRVAAETKKIGMALKELDAPLTGKVTLKCKLQFTGAAGLKNGYLAFGDRADEAKLVKCGLRVAMKTAAILQGPTNANKGVTTPYVIDVEKPHELAVTVDLASGNVTLKSGTASVTAKLSNPMKSITHVGYCTNNATVDFSVIEAMPAK
ncbi:MAG: PQQ-binding-like beta-propeller repeat protein [Verrucomicrobia bacterium]|nr:PQQ-binding-like beta-propeller repeat protein [Verrucomicrobiota bacterium]